MNNPYKKPSTNLKLPLGVEHFKFVASNYFLAMAFAYSVFGIGDKYLSDEIVDLIEGLGDPGSMNPWLFLTSIDLFLSLLFFVLGTYLGTRICKYHPIWTALQYAIIYAALNTIYRLTIYTGDTPLWYELCLIVVVFIGCLIGGSIVYITKSNIRMQPDAGDPRR